MKMVKLFLILVGLNSVTADFTTCFEASPNIYGLKQGSLVSDLSIFEEPGCQVTANHKIAHLSYCYALNKQTGAKEEVIELQFELKRRKNLNEWMEPSIPLSVFGSTEGETRPFECRMWQLYPSEDITEISIYYDNSSETNVITQISAVTSQYAWMVAGQSSETDLRHNFRFYDTSKVLMGFQAYQELVDGRTYIKGMGSIEQINACDPQSPQDPAIQPPGAPVNLRSDSLVTTVSVIGLTWEPPLEERKVNILGYRVSWDNGSRGTTWSVLKDGVTDTSITIENLSMGRAYLFRVTAQNKVGFGPQSETVTIYAASVPDSPAAPTTTLDGSNVVVSWELPTFQGGSQVTGYRVLIESIRGDFVSEPENCDMRKSKAHSCTIPVLKLTQDPFNLVPRHSIRAKVVAINLVGDSEPSLVGDGAILQTKPGAPFNLQVDALQTSASQIAVKWSEPDDGGKPISGYYLWIGLENAELVKQDSPLLTTGVTWTQVTKGETYKVRIQALNELGTSPLSEILLVQAAQKPEMPPTPTTQISGMNTVVVWAESDDGGSALTDYTVTVRQLDGEFSPIDCKLDFGDGVVRCSFPTQTLLDPPYSLSVGSNIYAQVQTTNVYGSSGFSSEGNGGVIKGFPDPPTDLSEDSTLRQPTSITLVWSAPEFDFGSPITGYKILVDNEEGATMQYSSEIEAKAVEFLTPGEQYEFKVYSVNEVGWSLTFATYSVKAGHVPNAPTGVKTSNQGILVNVDWTEPSVLNGSQISGYTVYVEGNSRDFYPADCEPLAQNECIINLITLSQSPFLLTENDSVRAKVTTTNEFGESAMSDIGSGAIVYTVPQSPTNLLNDGAATSKSQIRFTWEDSSNGGLPILDYSVYMLTSSVYELLGTVQTQSFMVAGEWTPGQLYSFAVTARNDIGSSAQSLPVEIYAATVPSQLLPPDVSILQQSVEIVWSEPDDNGGSPITDYVLEIEHKDGSFSQVCDEASKTSCSLLSVTLLEPPFSYTWGDLIRARVQAKNIVGSSEWSDLSVATELLSLPSPPETATIVNNGNQIVIEWSQVLDNGSPLADVQILVQTKTQAYSEITCQSDLQNSCAFLNTAVQQSPFNLVLDDQVAAKLVFSNEIGQTSKSVKGAQVWTVPSQPTGLKSDRSVTDSELIGLTWTQPSVYGGTPLIDYQLWQKTESGFILAQSEITDTKTTITDVQAGVAYEFRVKARNVIGSSEFSQAVSVTTTQPMAESPALALEPGLGKVFRIGGVVGAVFLITVLALAILALIKCKQTRAKNVKKFKVFAEFPAVEEPSQRHLMVNDLESQRVPIDEVYCIVKEESETKEKQYRVSALTEQQVTQQEEEGKLEAQIDHTIVDETSSEILQPDLPSSPEIESVLDYYQSNSDPAMVYPQDPTVEDSMEPEAQIHNSIAEETSPEILQPNLPCQPEIELVLDQQSQSDPAMVFPEDPTIVERREPVSEISVQLSQGPDEESRVLNEKGKPFSDHDSHHLNSTMPTNAGFTSNRVLNDETATQIIVEEVFDDQQCSRINEREGPQLTVEEVTGRMALTKSGTRLLSGRNRQRRHSDDLHQASTVSDKPLFKAQRPNSQNKTSRRKKRKQEDLVVFEDDYDEIRVMLRSLLEKKQRGVLNTLDKKLLKELQKLIDESPANYNSKIGYLQLLYR